MLDLTNKRYGRLTAIKIVGSNKSKHKLWLCKCDCGKETIVSSDSLKSGSTQSCGCLQKEKQITANIKHGYCGTRLYRIWKGMKSRCNNQGSTDYKWYGKNGIRVCKEWESFEPFMQWALSNGYKDNLTLDRINPYLNYSPENCRWATTAEQNMNRRSNYDELNKSIQRSTYISN